MVNLRKLFSEEIKAAVGRPVEDIYLGVDAQAVLLEIGESADRILDNDTRCEDEGYEVSIEELKTFYRKVPSKLRPELNGIISRLEVTLQEDRKDDIWLQLLIERVVKFIRYFRKQCAKRESANEKASAQ